MEGVRDYLRDRAGSIPVVSTNGNQKSMENKKALKKHLEMIGKISALRRELDNFATSQDVKEPSASDNLSFKVANAHSRGVAKGIRLATRRLGEILTSEDVLEVVAAYYAPESDDKNLATDEG